MPDFAELRGRQLAVQLMRELRDPANFPDTELAVDEEASEASLGAEPTILRRYVAIASRGGPEVERGFLCVLSHYLRESAWSGIDLEFYEELVGEALQRAAQ